MLPYLPWLVLDIVQSQRLRHLHRARRALDVHLVGDEEHREPPPLDATVVDL